MWEAQDPGSVADSKIFKQQDSGLDVGSNFKIPCGILRLSSGWGQRREHSNPSRGEAGMYSQDILIKARIPETEAGVG